MSIRTFIALLRGINVTGHNIIPMPELREVCTSIGWVDVRSYIQSGNVVFMASATQSSLEGELEQAILKRFELHIPVVVRSSDQWLDYIKGNPFPQESHNEPNRIMLVLSKALPLSEAVIGLRERAVNGELIDQNGGAIWIYYPDGVGKSKLTTALLDRLIGSTVTMRNWRTVLKLDEMLRNNPKE